MKHIITLLFAILPLFAAAQEFAVASFDLREMDLTAINEATKVVDDNNEVCALIKIETTERGFTFDGGTVGIAKVEDNHNAEIWVFVPAGLRKITIMHQQFGVIRDYFFPVTLVSARTYLMKLKITDQKSDKRLEEKTDSMQMQMAEIQRQMQQLMQNQQQGNSYASSTVAKSKYSGVFVAGGELKKVPENFQGDFVIGEDVTSIGESAFYSCTGLTSVTIPTSVTRIGSEAFCFCSRLTSVTIPSSVTSIDAKAFVACKGLTSVTIPNSVTSISEGTFNGCKSLTSVTIPNSVTRIGHSAFYGCSSLKSVTIPNRVARIEDKAFAACVNLTSVTLPNSVTSIGDYAFNGCKGLTSVTIPTNVTRIGRGAFYECNGLTSMTIPNSVTSVGDMAFSYCSGLTSMTVPASVMTIGNHAFDHCANLTTVTFQGTNTQLIDKDVFKECNALQTIYVPKGSLKYYKKMLPSNLKNLIVEQ